MKKKEVGEEEERVDEVHDDGDHNTSPQRRRRGRRTSYDRPWTTNAERTKKRVGVLFKKQSTTNRERSKKCDPIISDIIDP